jgi:hypothetical protein
MTGYELMKKHREDALEQSIKDMSIKITKLFITNFTAIQNKGKV